MLVKDDLLPPFVFSVNSHASRLNCFIYARNITKLAPTDSLYPLILCAHTYEELVNIFSRKEKNPQKENKND